MLAGLIRRRAICATGIGLLAALVAESCDKLPLFAPTESTITLRASRLGGSGDAELVATVIEQSGAPVQNGTTVIFTTTLGTIEPREARTNGGTATAVLRAGTQSGTATVSAFSGGTRATDDITILIGVTQTVILNATPGSLPSTGGDVKLIAVVHDANGNPLQGIPVVFTADAVVLKNVTPVTNVNGEASATLTTTRETIVTADAGGQRATVTVRIDSPVAKFTSTLLGNSKVNFDASASTGASLIYAWDFGDDVAGSGVSPSHMYLTPDTYTVRLTVVDSLGQSGTTTNSVTVP